MVLLAVAGVAVFLGLTVAHRSGQLVAKPVDGTICTSCVSVTGPSAKPTLYPGAPGSSMPVTFTNTTNGPIYVTELDVSFTNAFPSGCDASNFKVGESTPGATTSASGAQTTITYSPAQTIPAGQTWTDNTTLAMPDSNTSQDACKSLPLSISYLGKANYTVMTTTGLTTSTNTSTDTETLTATVGPDIQPASAGHTPGPGDGSVTFYTCSGSSSTSCTTLIGTSPVGAGGVATFTTSASAVGSYKVEAVFAPSDPTNYVTSTSPIVTENLSGCVAAPTGNAAVIVTGTGSGNYTAPANTSVWLNNATINGNVTVPSSSSLAATGGTINGSLTASGGPVAIAGTTITGNVQNTNGGLALGPSTLIKGSAQASGGGPFCSQGASSTGGQVQVRGNLQVQSLTSSSPATVCATTVGNNLLWQSNASPSTIGGTCGANTILGNMNVQNNSGPLSIGATGSGNAVSGNANVNGNSGGGTMTGNAVTGNCQLSGDKPGIVGMGNTTGKGNNQCNTTSSGA